MAKPIVVHDPYRNIDTTIKEFAKAEGVPKNIASHYYWWHKSLDGFRDRPAKGTGNGIKPHTYTRNGAFITLHEAQRVSGMDLTGLKRYREKYGTNDIDAIMRHREAALEQVRQTRLIVTEDGRKMTVAEYAKEHGASLNSVYCWISRKGTVRGFSSRGGSRVNPNLYRHSGMGVSKSMKEWARYFKCSVPTIKLWLRLHNRDLNGFENRRVTRTATYKGKKISEWARRLGVSYMRIYKYFSKHNRSLKGFDKENGKRKPNTFRGGKASGRQGDLTERSTKCYNTDRCQRII